LLTHYDLSKPLILACDASPLGLDASPVGLDAVLSHQFEKDEHPIAFASCSFTPDEKDYSQIDKEVLAIVFGVKIFVWSIFYYQV